MINSKASSRQSILKSPHRYNQSADTSAKKEQRVRIKGNIARNSTSKELRRTQENPL
jgi:hypothetical protein